MKRFASLLVAFLLAGVYGNVSAQQQASAPANGPKIEFKSQVIDYGEIDKGADGYRSFEFTNTGNAPLIINRVRSSCGCTIASKPEKPVMPGETAVIRVHYNTNHIGPFRKTVTVYSNAVNVPGGVVKLHIKGKVSDPNNVDLNRKKTASPVFGR